MLAQEGDLLVQGVLGQVDPPGARLSVLAAAPAVAPSLKGVLVLEGRAFRPEPEAGAARPLQEVRQGGTAGDGEGAAEDLERGQAVAERSVLVVEEAALGGQVGELQPFEALLAPGRLAHGAAPGLGGEVGVEPLGEAPVEGGVVREHDHRRRDEGADRLGIERMAGHRLGADARQRGDLGRDRPAGLVVALEAVHHAQHLALGRVGEAHHGELDHLVAAQVRPCGLHVDNEAQARARRREGEGGRRPQPSHHPILARSLQRGCHGLELLP